jgi:epoxyqueuosine reductase QueG
LGYPVSDMLMYPDGKTPSLNLGCLRHSFPILSFQSPSAVVIGLPIHLPALESAPSIWYREEYKTVNSLIDQYTWRLASVLNDHGFPSVSIPRDGYGSIRVLQRHPVAFFSHRHAAVLAGLGTFGRNNMVLTEKWGPRVRFGTVLTVASVPSDPLITEPLCTRCNACVRACPVNALSEEDYPDACTNKKACADRSAALNSGIPISMRYMHPGMPSWGRSDAVWSY